MRQLMVSKRVPAVAGGQLAPSGTGRCVWHSGPGSQRRGTRCGIFKGWIWKRPDHGIPKPSVFGVGGCSLGAGTGPPPPPPSPEHQQVPEGLVGGCGLEQLFHETCPTGPSPVLRPRGTPATPTRDRMGSPDQDPQRTHPSLRLGFRDSPLVCYGRKSRWQVWW